MFVNFTLHKFNEIIFVHKLLNINQLKARQTYTERSSFHYLSYLWVNGSRYEGTPLLRCCIALDEAVSWVNACASGASSWSAPHNSCLSLSLLEELAAILYSQHAINFPSGIYTNLWKKKQFWFLKKMVALPLYMEEYIITQSTASYDWCHVMCSAVFGVMNNLCSLGVIWKYLSFLCATRVLSQLCIFKVIQHAEVF